MGPPVLKALLIERPQEAFHLGLGEQCGAGRKQEPNGVLHRINRIDQVLSLHNLEHLEVILERRPILRGRRGEVEPRWHHADHRRRAMLEPNRLTDDGRIATKPLLP